ncbi:hypothetical protein [Kribbella sp. NPDC051770]|uniref:hypothetical protein n=1 Tax=Kribbella sp. NPDC051770 TaxID=3155413 RepID=UPI0034431622
MTPDPQRRPVLALLLSTDALLIALHLLAAPDVPALDISRDYTVPEFVTYLKLLATVLLLIRAGVRAWPVIFAYLLLDDVLRLHEFFGEGLVRLIDDPNRHLLRGLRTEDLGELAILLAAAIPLLALLITSYRRGSPPSRRTDRRLALLLLTWAFFSIGIDLLSATFSAPTLPLIEDAGELITLTLITTYASSLSTDEKT